MVILSRKLSNNIVRPSEDVDLYEPHPVFEEPNESARLWRYMTFGKFVSLLSRGALFFCRVDRLQDRFEGQLPRPTYDITHPLLRASYEQERVRSILNCWTCLVHESVALWNTYVPQGEGVAILTTFARLRGSFRAIGIYNEARVHIGRVRYVDFQTHNFVGPDGTAFNGFLPLVHKRPYFEFESEVRALISGLGTHFLDQIIRQSEGLHVPVTLDMLIEGIRVAPGSPDWFLEATKSVSQVFGLSGNLVSRSEIDIPPPADATVSAET